MKKIKLLTTTKQLALFIALLPCAAAPIIAGNAYKNFEVAVYARAYEVQKMDSLQWLEPIWAEMSQQLKIDKIYLETHRDRILVDEKTIESAKKYFKAQGIKVAGGITFTINEGNRYETFCYTNPEHRKRVKEIAEYTAKHFDEIILDDFFFTNCKCELCIKAKGNLSWTQYRLKLMKEAAEELVIEPAGRSNPKVKIVIKFPNWYKHFQGWDLIWRQSRNCSTEFIRERKHATLFTADSIFSNTKVILSIVISRTSNRAATAADGLIPEVLSYMDRYAEQLWMTLFAKAPEITLFDFRQLQRPVDCCIRSCPMAGIANELRLR